MRLYAGRSSQFIKDSVQNQIAGKLKDAFFRHYRYQPGEGEVMSWQNSLRAMSQVFTAADLTDHGVILEYQLPLTSKRLDCLITGKDNESRDNAVIVELKQWQACTASPDENLVTTWVGKGHRDVLHPSVQVNQYQQYLEDSHTAFHEEPLPISLSSCAYLHNYVPETDDVILGEPFNAIRALSPTFMADDVPHLTDFLVSRLSKGDGWPLLQRVEQGKYRPCKRLMDHVGNVVKGIPQYVLLDEQLVVYSKVLSAAKKGFDHRKKTVVIAHGGPGTGKSVIAMNLLGTLSLEGYNTHYATGSKAFTGTLRQVVGTRASQQFKFFNGYVDAQLNEIDVLICDEAHRIRESSNDRFRPRLSKRPQIDELITAAKVCVFFIDDRQVVRPNEIGSAEFIRTYAQDHGCEVLEYDLPIQFRCAGSDSFVNWVNNTLGIERTPNVMWEGDEKFEFRIVSSPEELDQAIRSKVAEGSTGRLAAGFCWRWSDPTPERTLKNDVVIGAFERPWNAKTEKKLANGIPPSNLWAYDPNGIDQVGCIYTAQGFEFDYAGVIWGDDLRYNFDAQAWEGHPECSYDTVVKRSKDNFLDLVKNSYRVLLSRGLKGCYVCFTDKDTERFVRSRIESVKFDSSPQEPENT